MSALSPPEPADLGEEHLPNTLPERMYQPGCPGLPRRRREGEDVGGRKGLLSAVLAPSTVPWGHWQASSFWGKTFLPVSPCRVHTSYPNNQGRF